MAPGALATCALAGQEAYCWGSNVDGTFGRSPPRQRTRAASPERIAALPALSLVSVGLAHACGISADSEPMCWGRSHFGELGSGTMSSETAPPSVVAGGQEFESVSAGSYYSCGVTTAGVAYCWGFNGFGQLGTGDIANAAVPTRVQASVSFIDVAASSSHTCGLAAAGEVYCWGLNLFGQIGATSAPSVPCGDGECVLEPVQVESDVGFSQVVLGGYHTCALVTDGSVYCWGANGHGQIGEPAGGSTTPRAVPGLPLVVDLATAGSHTCAVDAGGAAYCWGDNTYGQLGNGQSEAYLNPAPTPVAGGVAFLALSAGPRHTCGLSTQQRVYCWGLASDGRIGDGTVQPPGFALHEVRPVPTPVADW